MMSIMGPSGDNGGPWKILGVLRLIAKLPMVVLAIVAAGMASWLGFWLIIRASMFIYHHWLSRSWS